MKACPDFTTALYSRAEQLTPQWDAILPADHDLSRTRLLREEATYPADVSPMYVQVSDARGPVMVAVFQVLQMGPQHVRAERLKPWQKRLWQTFSKIRKPRLLVGGHLFRHDYPALHTTGEYAPFDYFKAYRLAIKKAARRSRADAVLLKEMPEFLHPHFLHFAPNYRIMPGDISMELTLQPEWENFADYEKALKHKYAQRMRNIRKSCSSVFIKELSTEEVQQQASALYALYQHVAQHQAVRLGFMDAQYLPSLKQHYPETFCVWGFYENDKLVAFSSAWQKGTVLDMFYIGFDYERNRVLQLYFNILFHAVEIGILQRLEKVIYGRTALEAKARIGARPVYLHTFLYIRNPVARALVDRLQQALAETDGDWESRHPFK